MKKSISLLFALACAFSLSAKTIYLVPNSNWKQASARFAIYTWNDNGSQWIDMTATTTLGTYKADIPDGYSKIIFCRMKPSTTENNWDNKWNQSSDLVIPADNDCYTVAEGAWDKGNGTWSTYVAPCNDYGIMVGETYTAAEINPTPIEAGVVEYMVLNLNLKQGDTFTMYNNCAKAAWVISNFKENSYKFTIEDEKYVVTETGKYDLYFTLNIEGDAIYVSFTRTTPTDNISITLPAEDAPVYNLLGVQVDSNYRGIVIQNGQKFIQK